MKPQVISIHLLVEPREDPNDEPWTENDVGLAIEDAVDEFKRRLSRHGLKLLDYQPGNPRGVDETSDLYVDHDPERPFPSFHSLLGRDKA